jgi:hypothetical protein
VDELLHCYVQSANCTLFQSIARKVALPSAPWDLYVGVHQNDKTITVYTKALMIVLQGTNVTNITSEEDCKTTKKVFLIPKKRSTNLSLTSIERTYIKLFFLSRPSTING